MKHFLFFIFFIGFSFNIFLTNAQSVKEPLGFYQKSDDNAIDVYPNPAKDLINLKTKDSSVKIKMVTFYSILGTEIASFNINNNYAELRLDRLKAGRYLMTYVLSDNTQKVTQIIKQ